MSKFIVDSQKLRNVAIVAHVDHGKTTLVDAFLKQTDLFREGSAEMSQEQLLDSGDLEKEKGITIKAKNTSIRYKDHKINIIDTPGHSDFGGEVERTLNMADGCLLLVDAQEGPMPQTKFVLKKALELGLTPMVVVNKIDKQFARPNYVLDKINDLFLELVVSEDQLNFPIFYAVARDGKIYTELPELSTLASSKADVFPLLDKIVADIPAPDGDENLAFRMQVTSLDYDDHQGRYLIGRVDRGTLSTGDKLSLVNDQQKLIATGTVKSVLVREGLVFEEVDTVNPGEIVALTGIDAASIGATLCDPQHLEPLPQIKISPPSVRMKFEANTSPFLGQEGDMVNFKQIQARLEKESENNIGLDIEKTDGGYYVAGRGELQLGILIEEMRREGFEFQVRKPEIVYKYENGKKLQPLEEMIVDVPEEFQSVVTKSLLERKATLNNVELDNGQVRLTVDILTANVLGLRNDLVTLTKNQAIINSFVKDYVAFTNEEGMHRNGALISMATGTAMGYSLNTIQERGELFVSPADKVYEGMLLGINKYEQDLEVNPTKERQKSGVRMKNDEITHTSLKPPKDLTLEFALVFMAEDEMLEVTPQNLRLRKNILKKTDRVRAARSR